MLFDDNNHSILQSLPTRRSSDLMITLIEDVQHLEVDVRRSRHEALVVPHTLGLVRGDRHTGMFCDVVLQGTSRDRKSTRLNSSHLVISYAVFCLNKIKTKQKLNN